MNATVPPDVPSAIDHQDAADAKEWERTALEKRPWRTEFFAEFANAIRRSSTGSVRVLELGSGPGFLAEHLLTSLPGVSMVLFDFSLAMHDLARTRLGSLATRATFVKGSFREINWTSGLGNFDFVVTNQAIHELRHKRYAVDLHRQVRTVLKPAAIYLACDHYVGEDGMRNDQLYMTVEEQRAALQQAGFASVTELLRKGGLVLHSAT